MKKLMLGASLLLLAGCIHTSGQMNRGELLTKNKLYEIPYAHTDKFIELPAGLRGQSFPFFLDSGSPTFISQALQQRFHYPILIETDAVASNGKTQKVTIVSIDTIRIGPFTFTQIPALVFDIPHSVMNCYGFEGNIGSNILRFLVAKFDLRQHKVSLTDNASLLKNGPVRYSPMALDGQSNASFEVKVNGDQTDHPAFDSGDGLVYHISGDATAALAEHYPNQVMARGTGITSMGMFGTGASIRQYIFKPAGLTIGSATIRRPLAYTTANNHSTLGRGLLNYGILLLDYTGERYAFEPYTTPAVPAEFNFGFNIVVDKNRLVAGTVWEGSPAAKGGLKSGDEILSVNGRAISSIAECDLTDSIKQLMNVEKIVISFQGTAPGSPQQLTLTKASL